MTDDNNTIELAESTVNTLASYFGYRQTLTPNADEEYASEGLVHLGALVELGEAYGAVDSEHGFFETSAELAMHLWPYVFDGERNGSWRPEDDVIQDVVDTTGEYHPGVVALVESRSPVDEVSA